MKIGNNNQKGFLAILVVLLSFTVIPSVNAEIPSDILEVTGKVRNSKNKKPLENVSVYIKDTNIGTVTNSDGFFSLKFPAENLSQGLRVDLIGFQAITLPIPRNENSRKNLSIFLNPTGKVLNEVFVLGGDPKEIVSIALEKIPENYSERDNLFQGFYRETVQKGNRYIGVSEAMMDVLKKPYKRRNVSGENVSIRRGRTLISQKSSDTLAVKLMGGPYMPISLDAVKNADHLFSNEEIENFEFTMLPATMIDSRPHYSIGFKPKVELPYPLNKGTFYIDAESFTISRVEFEVEMKDKTKVTNSILQKKPKGLHFNPLEVSGVVSYKTVDGKSYINYVSTKIRFKCDWKKRLFYSTYTSVAEMVMVDREELDEKNPKLTDTFGKRNIFSDMVENYWEPDYWKDYNIIEPSEPLENAVKKLKK